MRIGIKRWQLELELSKATFQARIPLRIKLTFYIGIVAVIGMVLLAVVCILKSLSYTQRLMQERLSQFAATNAQQIERAVTNQVTTLKDAVQADNLVSDFESLYYGNISTDAWAQNMESLGKYLFSTSLLAYQALYLYDNSGSLLFYITNPGLSEQKVKELTPIIPKLLPLGSVIDGQTLTQVGNNRSAAMNASASAAAAASRKELQANATYKLAQAIHGEPQSGKSANFKQTNSQPPLNFTTSQEGVPSWLSQPQALVGDAHNITAYSYSITIPISEMKLSGDVQTSQLIGYCSAVIDCSQYLYDGTSIVYNSSILSKEMRDPWFTILEADELHGWRYLFPTGFNYTTDSRWHSLSEFPAVAADLVLQKRQHNSSQKLGGGLTHTKTPRVSKASVGYSSAVVLNRNWFVLLSLPQSQVEAGYRELFKTLAGVATAILVFVLFSAFFVTGLTTKPLLHIYHNMELRPRPPSRPRKDHKGRTDEKDLKSGKQAEEEVKKTTVLSHTFHPNLSSRTLVSLFGMSHSDEEATIGEEQCEAIVEDGGERVSELADDADHECEATIRSVSSDQQTIREEMEEEDNSTEFHVPAPLQPLHRWISDEFDELISEYNMMVNRLNAQYTKMEDEVRLRTHEARESQRLAEAANAAKSKFIMNISHELLTPMNGIMGFTVTTAEETDMEAIHQGLHKIIKSGNILQELLKELLTYAAHLASVEEKTTPFSMMNLADQIRSSFGEFADSKDIAFEVNTTLTGRCADGTMSGLADLLLESDFERIEQVCAHIVSNAIKFSEPSKTATQHSSVGVQMSLIRSDGSIETAPSAQQSATKMAVLEVLVHDNGVGISQDRLAHIFEVFVQGDDALSKRFTGTGLGLAMSKLLCERLGGYIKVYTRANIGSTAVFRVPVNASRAIYFEEHGKAPSKALSTPVFAEPHGSRTVWRTDSREVGVINGIKLVGRRYSTHLAHLSLQGHLIGNPHGGQNANQQAVPLSPIVESPTSQQGGRELISAGPYIGSGQSSPQSGSQPNEVAKVPFQYELPTLSTAELRAEVKGASSMHVLVADDNAVLRNLLRRYLEKLGVGQIDTAASGDDVIQFVEAAIVNGTRYSIIFLDLTMPDTDGLEATRSIRRQLGYMCPVVALTGHSDTETVDRCLEAGLQRVLVKPVSLAQLAESITELVGKPLDTEPTDGTSLHKT